MFDINENLAIYYEQYNGSKFFTVDNFLKKPETLMDFLKENPASFHKENQTPSFNKIHFLDRRHEIYCPEFIIKLSKLFDIEGQYISPNYVYTNVTKMITKEFNDYQNNYWWPHLDSGLICLLYLNEYDGPGTNIYERVDDDEIVYSEHYEPWRKKKKYKIVKTFGAKYNRMIAFDAGKFLHGMAIDDDTFFETDRINLVVFFHQ